MFAHVSNATQRFDKNNLWSEDFSTSSSVLVADSNLYTVPTEPERSGSAGQKWAVSTSTFSSDEEKISSLTPYG